jgi:hypothetical protein
MGRLAARHAHNQNELYAGRLVWNKVRQPTDAKALLGYSIEVDRLLKSRSFTIGGAANGAREVKTRFPMLQIRICEATAKTRIEVIA